VIHKNVLLKKRGVGEVVMTVMDFIREANEVQNVQ
jgi:hypothetical protein